MMKSIKCLYAASLLAIGSTAAMAQASYTDKDENEYQFKRHWFLEQGRMERIQGYQGRYSVYRQLQMEICSSGCGLYVQPL